MGIETNHDSQEQNQNGSGRLKKKEEETRSLLDQLK
jgi:hypothetical protein